MAERSSTGCRSAAQRRVRRAGQDMAGQDRPGQGSGAGQWGRAGQGSAGSGARGRAGQGMAEQHMKRASRAWQVSAAGQGWGLGLTQPEYPDAAVKFRTSMDTAAE
eukprot:14999211-Alexandrium_andersonii.AAC.1